MSHVPLTLSLVAAEPQRATSSLCLPDGEPLLFRPLLPTDVDTMAAFLSSLSPQTRQFWDMAPYDQRTAQKMCDAIARYDKFRMVAVKTADVDAPLLALFEFAFHLGSDLVRFHSYGIPIQPEDTCRFGPCIRDDFQDCGLGSALMPHALELARRFGKRSVILWGGVLKENDRAIHFYQKHGFRIVGTFQEQHGRESLDMILSLSPDGGVI